MKKIAVFLTIVMLVGLFPCIHSIAEVTDGISITCVNGEILVSGSFTADSYAGESYNVYLATYEEDGTLLKVDVSEDLTVLEGTNEVNFTAPNVRNVQNTKAFVWTKRGLNDLCASAEKTIYTLKVLGIGNSFTQDAMEHLYNIADDYGIDNIVLGYAYKGSCSLETHWDYISNNSQWYTYYKNTSGSWSTTNYQRINTMLQDEDWNLIVLQQASQYSGMTDTFEPYLTNIIDCLNERKTNKYAELAWHMTWAYQQDSTHSGFANYNEDQMTMYNAIVGANKFISDIDEIDFLIPSGTAIQNARTSYIGDTLTRDGYHLDKNLGRYIAAMTWFRKILGLSPESIDWVPDSDKINAQALSVAKESVANAINNPDGITASTHTEDLGSDYIEYTELDYEIFPNSFYESTVQANPYNEITASGNGSLNKYVSTKIFYKDELPNGTIFEIDSGYQYRPEGWTDLTVKNGTGTGTSGITRPVNVTTNRVVIDDEWWGDFNYRAFNIAYEDNTTAITDPAEVASHFRILIPKNAERLVELDFETFGGAYYNSYSSTPSTLVTTKSNSKYFVATEILEKSKIPNGSVIMIEPDFQYRPEGWETLTTKNSSRPDNVTQVITVVDDTWWGDFNYRAFNIAYEGGVTTLTDKVDYVVARFHILVPVN